MTNERVELEFVADTTGVEQGFNKVDNGLRDLDSNVKQASNSVSGFFNVFAGSFAAGVVQGAIRELAGAIGAIPDIIARGSGIDDITSSFNNLATAAGATGDVFIDKLSSALSDTIPKVDLMQKANELMLGGLKPDQIELVAKAARTLGEVTGTDAAQGMDQFADSLLRGNDRALKTLGIVVDNEKAISDYAVSVGKLTQNLSEQEKVEALRAASLQALADNTEKLGAVTDDAGDVIAQISTAIQNQVDEAIKAVGTNQDLQRALEDLRDTIKDVDFGPIIAGLAAVISKTGEAAAAVIAFANSTSAIDRAVAKTSGEYKVLDAELVKITETLGGGTVEATKKAEKAFNDLVSVINETGVDKGVAAALGEDLKSVREQIEAAKKSYGLLTTEIVKTDKAVGDVTKTVRTSSAATKDASDAAKEAAAQEKKRTEEAKKALEALNQTVISSEKYERILIDLKNETISSGEAGEKIRVLYTETAKNVKDLAVATEIYNGMLAAVGRGANVAADDLAKAATEVERLSEAVKGAAQKAGGGSFLDLLVGEGLDPGQSQVATAIGSALSSAISDAINSGDVGSAIKNAGASLGQALGSAAGASLGPIGAAVGGSIGQALADKFIKGVEGIGKSSQGTGKGIKTILDSIFPGIGSGLDFLIGDKLFGGDSKGTQTRKQVDKFFADAFDAQRLMVIIEGQLQQITDLDLGGGLFGDTGSAAGEFFANLATDAQNGFSAVAQGFAQMLGVGEEAAAGLAIAFADNLGGSLNNLQLLVEATGLSFDQMREQVVAAFLDGKLSAAEAQNALNGIAQVSQKGIPDGIGLISQAFDNMKAAGTKGGRALIDAIQDIGFEAKELGQKDLSQVIASLVATGKYSTEEIQQVFDALKASGITTVDQLTSATAEQLLPVLAELENTKFPFAEQVKDVRAYIEAVESIPTNKDVQLNLKVNYANSADQKVVQDLAGRGAIGQGSATL